MSNKHLLILAKDYWSNTFCEHTALYFSNKFSNLVNIPDNQITHHVGADTCNVKNIISQFVQKTLNNNDNNNNNNHILYIYLGGYYNSIFDSDGNDNSNDSYVINSDIIQQINGLIYSSSCRERPLIVFISNNSSTYTLINHLIYLYFDVICLGSSLEYKDSYQDTQYDNVIISLLNSLEKNKDTLHELTAIQLFNSFDTQLRSLTNSYNAIIGVSYHSLRNRTLFN